MESDQIARLGLAEEVIGETSNVSTAPSTDLPPNTASIRRSLDFLIPAKRAKSSGPDSERAGQSETFP